MTPPRIVALVGTALALVGLILLGVLFFVPPQDPFAADFRQDLATVRFYALYGGVAGLGLGLVTAVIGFGGDVLWRRR